MPNEQAAEQMAKGREMFAAYADWFKHQWLVYRAKVESQHEGPPPPQTHSVAYLYGGVQAYREQFRTEPQMSRLFKKEVEWLDGYYR